jgi:ribA/ribD-fused uncharacterized protein
MKIVEEFKDDYFFLSNFYPCLFIWNGILWRSVEAAYQCAKSKDFPYYDFQHLSPSEAKRKGQKVIVRENWDGIKVKVMKEIVYEKFQQNKELADKLLETGDMILKEGNWWGDKFWGVSPKSSDNGKNFLGLILMKTRRKLNEEKHRTESVVL